MLGKESDQRLGSWMKLNVFEDWLRIMMMKEEDMHFSRRTTSDYEGLLN